MRRDNVNYLVVGLFVLSMLAALMVGLYYVTGRSGPTDPYYVTYPHVTGLSFGTPVYYEGYPVGQVEDISPVRVDEGRGLRYRVRISVAEGWAIPADSVARMTATGLLAALSINIHHGDSERMLEPGGELRGEAGGDLFGTMQLVATDMNRLAQGSLKPLLDNLNTELTRISGHLDEHGPAILSESRQLMARLNTSAGRLEALLSEANQRQLEAVIHNARETSENALAMSRQGRELTGQLNRLAADIGRTRAEVDGLLGDLRGVVGENRDNVAAALQDLRRTLDVAARNVDQMAYHLKGTSRNMHEFSRQIRQNPGLLLGGKPPTDPREAAP